MKNPWTTKNPLLSMWLSGANTVLGKTYGPAMSIARREASKAVSTASSAGIKQLSDFWANVLLPPTPPRKRRRTR